MGRLTCIFLHLLVLACSSTPKNTAKEAPAPIATSATPTESTAPAAASIRDTDPMYEKASAFDKYLNSKLELDETQALLHTCNNNPGDNIFCFSIVNYDVLEEKLKLGPPTVATGGGRRGAVRPRFKKRVLSNWIDLRFASISSTLKSVASVNSSDLMQIKKFALNEKKCPNNAAISVAAALEDWLPDRVALSEVATLYEKGADCLVNNAADRESLMTRAGLFFFAAKEYRKAEAVFAIASAINDAFVARPLYWLYRSRTELKMQSASTALESMKRKYPFSFHTLVALTAANRDPGEILNRNDPMHLKRSLKEPTLNSLIEQVEVLHRLGFDRSAAKVLDWAITDFQEVEPEVRIYLAELKKEQGDYHSKITILSDVLYKHPALISRQTMELYFPKVFFPLFDRHSTDSGIDPYLLLAIARRESAFRPRAISGANARGLMQVLPSTGKKISATSDLLDPDGNILVGSKYVLELLRKVNGQIHLALGAYNAGPSKVAGWTRRYEAAVDDPILFIDLIPYRETREYVASVLRNYYWYRRIHRGEEKMTSEKILELANIKAESKSAQ